MSIGSASGRLRTVDVFHVLGGGGFDLFPVGQPVGELDAVDFDGVRTVVLDHDQNRQNAVAPGIELAESVAGLVIRLQGLGGDGDFFAGLVMRIQGSGLDFEFGLIVVGRRGRGYTNSEEQRPP